MNSEAVKLLSDVKHILKTGYFYDYPALEREVTDIKKALFTAVHFYVGSDGWESIKGKANESTVGSEVHLPYKAMTLAFDFSDVGSGDAKCIALAVEVPPNEVYASLADRLPHGYILVKPFFKLVNPKEPSMHDRYAPAFGAIAVHCAEPIQRETDGTLTLDCAWLAPVDPTKVYINDYLANTNAHDVMVQFLPIATALIDLIVAISTTHTEEVIQQSSPKNNRRILDGKLPIWEVKTLVLKTPVTRTVSEYQGGTHASPRQHIRRGHYRHYKSGKIAWVRDCIVGSLEKGFVHKDYRVEPAAA